ncbi:MAG TPA: serine hydrolase domain-containing protein [Eudoraea sp.]|nr:serine hydrolase domain-containing protein [Eudoraea sp.]
MLRICILSYFLGLLTLYSTFAQDSTITIEEAFTHSIRGPHNPVELEIFFDGLFPALIDAYHVPGAVVVVVKGDSLLFSKGYGYANLDNRIPVDPATTLFRIASVSKLIAATIVMQQVEQGNLDLDTDVNDYLSEFKILEAFGQPVTLRNLLTHTAGFDDTFPGTTESLTANPTPLSEFLNRRQPDRVIPPGEVISYSNYGFALAGHLVERTSGQSYDAYVEDYIFSPLGMDQTQYGIPVEVPATMAQGYYWNDEQHVTAIYDRIKFAPAAEVIATGLDMGRFMSTFLQMGELKEQRILREATVREMLSRQFTHHPELTGWGLGFIESVHNKVPVWSHGGSWAGFGTELMLIPEANVGIFVSTNQDRADSGGFFNNFFKQVFDHYFPLSQRIKLEPSSGFPDRAAVLLGSYRDTRRFRNSLAKASGLTGTMQLSMDEDGTLVYGGMGFPSERYIEVDSLLFAQEDGDKMMTFQTDDEGRVKYLFVDGLSISGWSLEPVPWHQNPSLHSSLLVVIIIFFVLSVFGWLLGWLARRIFNGPPSAVLPAARWTAFSVCLLQAIFLVCLFVLLGQQLPELSQHLPTYLIVLLILPLVSLVLTLFLPYFLVTGYTRDVSAPLAKLHYWCLVVLSFLVLGIEWYWNLLGFQY